MTRDIAGLGDDEGLPLASHGESTARPPSPALSDASISDSSLSSMSSLSIHDADVVETRETPQTTPSSLGAEATELFDTSSSTAPVNVAPGIAPGESERADQGGSKTRSAKEFHKWQGSKKRRQLKRTKASKSPSLSGPAASYRIKTSMKATYRTPQTSNTSFDAVDMPSARGAFVGIRQRVVRKRPFTLDELMSKGFQRRRWDGRYVIFGSTTR